ncbi:DUF1345 domain-containing protein [Iodidimonas sp. SYSU 1G8]|uniref:DUF1345 domain-containing protein n=1 Tax=Iodidimonas sp. SYSU 1G8 TaxID=3133967 RepID=UPI0031FF4272
MVHSVHAHLRRHLWFYLAVLAGIALWAALDGMRPSLRLALSGDMVFATYLLAAIVRLRGSSPGMIRKRAERGDEGIVIIMLITLAAVALSLESIFGLVNAPEREATSLFLLSLLGVPLGWTTLHTVMAFHYAHRFYAVAPGGGDARGLEFPNTPEPSAWDFLYHSFTIGMTAQVSDVQVTDGATRRMTLLHGVVSFFFNAVIVALAVNVAIARTS